MHRAAAAGVGPSASAARLAARVPPEGWLRISAGNGAKGRRWYGWSRLPLTAAGAPNGWGGWLLLRRSLRTRELAYYLCAGPAAHRWSPWAGWPGRVGGMKVTIQLE